MSTSTRKEDSSIDSSILIRLAAASVVFVVSLVLDLPAFLQIILLAAAAAAAGFDVAMDAVDCVQKKDYFAAPVFVILVTFGAFLIGSGMEGTALLILYQIGIILVEYVQEHTRQSALELIHSQDNGIADHMAAVINSDELTETALASDLKRSAGSVLKFAMIFAVVYAVALPLFTTFSYTVSIHRALVIILISAIGSVVASLPSTAAVSMCHAAGQGTIPGTAASLECLSDVKIAVFDKAGIFSDGAQQVIAVQSSVLDSGTFAAFAAHSVYYSEQPFARAVSSLYNKDYKLDVISNFVDITGVGVELAIGGAPVILARRELFSDRGVSIPAEEDDVGQVFYMTVAGKYVGKITLSNDSNEASANLVSEFRAQGVDKCILLTEESRGDSAAFAGEMQFTGLFSQCDTETKLKCIRDIKDAASDKVMYIYSSGIQTHSAADLDIRVSKKTKYADLLVLPEKIANLPQALQISAGMCKMSKLSTIIAFVVKAALIFLAIIGYCNLWFAIVLDTAASIATILISSRVIKKSAAIE